MQTYQEYLRNCAVPRSTIDVFLDPAQPAWARFDHELGYVLGNSMPRDGIDGCRTISTAAHGVRTSHLYTQRPCRINTYGNSFTQCHQVSDAETWQEYLAGHFGEPVRNFGMGGYGTYQAYRRMLRVEQSAQAAEYVILYLWGDDHLRSALRSRHPLIVPWWDHQGGLAFHNNFWANLEMDLDSARFVERPNILPTPQSLYNMTDPEFMLESLHDDLMLQLCLADRVDPFSLDLRRIGELAAILNAPQPAKSSEAELVQSLDAIKHAYGFAATRHVLEAAADFCARQNRKLLILLFCPKACRQLLMGHPRYDLPLLRHVQDLGLKYADMNLMHAHDYACFNLSVDEYLKRYFIGHYSPAGNHFFAYKLKNLLVQWLDPPPITYSKDDAAPVDFTGYLPD